MELRAIKVWYDGRAGLVELDDDVLSIVRQIRERYGNKVSVEVDPQQQVYHFVEHSEDGTDRLIFSTEELDGRALDRLLMSDSQRRMYQDPYDAAERDQDKAHDDYDKRYGEKIKEVGEELAHAIRKDGNAPFLPLPVAIPRGLDDA